jgi:hypothetical protein
MILRRPWSSSPRLQKISSRSLLDAKRLAWLKATRERVKPEIGTGAVGVSWVVCFIDLAVSERRNRVAAAPKPP